MIYTPGHKFTIGQKTDGGPSVLGSQPRAQAVLKPFEDGQTYELIYVNVIKEDDDKRFEYQFRKNNTTEIVKETWDSTEFADRVIGKYS